MQLPNSPANPQPQGIQMPILPPAPMPTQWMLNEAGYAEGKKIFLLSFGTPAGTNHYFFNDDQLREMSDAFSAKVLGLALVKRA